MKKNGKFADVSMSSTLVLIKMRNSNLTNITKTLVYIKATKRKFAICLIKDNFANILLSLILMKVTSSKVAYIFSTVVLFNVKKQPVKAVCYQFQFVLSSWPPVE
jgi:hypothetical protein